MNNETIDIEGALRDIEIPAKPQLLVDIDNLLNEEEPDIARISSLIVKDVAISAAVLKVINSPLFGLKKKVLNIKQAALYIGINGIVSLVKGMLLKQAFRQEQCTLNLGRFWDTADEVADIAVKINQACELGLPPDELYVLGLFHDIGLAVFASTYLDYKSTLEEANRSYAKSLVELELDRYGLDHSELGQILAKLWNLPDLIGDVIKHHHHHIFWQQNDDERMSKLNAVLQLSDSLVHKFRRGKSSYDWLYAKEYVQIVLGLSDEKVAELQVSLFELEIQ
jgi:HD-like signal output (HDOD) protein